MSDRSWWRRKRAALSLLLLVGLGGSGLLLGLEYRPAWYAPRSLTEPELRQARMEAMRILDHVGDELVARKPFDAVVSQDQLNDWLSGLDQIWPDAARRIPHEVIEPLISFQTGSLRTAARLESSGWRAIVSTDSSLHLSSDKKNLVVRLNSVRCGAVPVPRFVVRWCVQPYLRAETLHGFTLDQLYDGLLLENRFVWPNGKRPFRIDELGIERGTIRFRIQPL
jgi:hypothetical protein